MTRVLNQNADQAAVVANNIAEFLQHDLGYDDPSDVIPGLVMLIGLYAVASADPQRAMDEAADLLQSFDESDMNIVKEGDLIEN